LLQPVIALLLAPQPDEQARLPAHIAPLFDLPWDLGCQWTDIRGQAEPHSQTTTFEIEVVSFEQFGLRHFFESDALQRDSP
jgi:hypothetical protein